MSAMNVGKVKEQVLVIDVLTDVTAQDQQPIFYARQTAYKCYSAYTHHDFNQTTIPIS